MELVSTNRRTRTVSSDNSNESVELIGIEVQGDSLQYQQKPFIEANTQEVSMLELKNDCIIPVFSKDNERTISHQEFIEAALDSICSAYPQHSINAPEIRVSHQIKGRTPDAIHKPAKELLDHERTQYFERMAFIIRIPSIVETVHGNQLSLIVGGVRAYNHENLYSKKSMERFKFFIGFQNMVCCNLCVSTDGFKSEVRVGSFAELKSSMMELIQTYQMEQHLLAMKEFPNYGLSESQFAQLIGKCRLYNYLPKGTRQGLPDLLLNDGQISSMAKDYYLDESFCRGEDGNINLWNVFNLFTSANKSSYIDTFLDRNTNAFNFTLGLKEAISGDSDYSWFLS
ncbi:DUF3871 family protein [Muricauda sp. HICW]|uniref:DUF3871 family protein n=1 Tax=Flagellimonas chongwuensis TaxID=2697365 RepID=A0A850NF15_9FLAO|nr:DUF3871 family protein [Allomuricauda chongwuensis]NVN19443.1 DUF3871 family protein [Allomuricauda chongwuensis]